MKAKDLKPLFSWDDRRPILDDRVLFVPRFFDHHGEYDIPPLSSGNIFPAPNPIYIEFCSGNGEWIIEKALENPNINWIAVEKQFKRVRKIWSKMKNANLSNVLIVCGMAEDLIQHYVQEDEVSKIFINFPDPWPKKRHSKHRLMQTPFLDRVSEILIKDGEFILVTDDIEYSTQAMDLLSQRGDFTSVISTPYYQTNSKAYGSSYFDRLWRSLGREIRCMQYQKRARGGSSL